MNLRVTGSWKSHLRSSSQVLQAGLLRYLCTQKETQMCLLLDWNFHNFHLQKVSEIIYREDKKMFSLLCFLVPSKLVPNRSARCLAIIQFCWLLQQFWIRAFRASGVANTKSAVVGMLLAIAHFGSSHHASLAEKVCKKKSDATERNMGSSAQPVLKWSQHQVFLPGIRVLNGSSLRSWGFKTRKPTWPTGELERENSCAQGKNVETSTMLLFKVAPKKDTVRFDKPNPSKSIPRFQGVRFLW